MKNKKIKYLSLPRNVKSKPDSVILCEPDLQKFTI